MPDTSPLRPISHWRIETAAIVVAKVLKAQPLRKFNGPPAADQGKGRSKGGERSDASHAGPGW